MDDESDDQVIKSYPLTPEDTNRVDNNFRYHKPNDEQSRRYTYLRGHFRATAVQILTRTPKSREQSLALSALEDAMMWANAAIARNEGDDA